MLDSPQVLQERKRDVELLQKRRCFLLDQIERFVGSDTLIPCKDSVSKNPRHQENLQRVRQTQEDLRSEHNRSFLHSLVWDLPTAFCRDGEVSQGPRGPEDLPRTKALFYFPTAENDVHAEVVSKELPGQ